MNNEDNNFIKIISSIVESSGGGALKVSPEKFLDSINECFIFNPKNYWLGVEIQKSPLDLMILQEIIFERKPNTIIECGTFCGGSAIYMATLMDLMGIDGKVITIDKDIYPLRSHPKIEYIHSDCLKATLPEFGGKTMVVLDCDHSADHVERELEKFSKMVTLGQYIIVEDMVIPDKDNGPAGAVNKFLITNKNFIIDKNREKYGISSNLGGYLLKI